MHGAVQLLLFWGLAFLSLGTAVVCLNVFGNLIGDGVELLSVGKKAAIAAVASLVEAVSVWLLIAYVPGAGHAMILPALIVACIYKVAHLTASHFSQPGKPSEGNHEKTVPNVENDLSLARRTIF